MPPDRLAASGDRLADCDDIEVLHRVLATMPVIEQAKGALMVVYGLSAEGAFELLRWYSQHRNVKLREIATILTENLPELRGMAAVVPEMDRMLEEVARRVAESPRADRRYLTAL